MLAIIQARSNSKRFKNKVLHSIYGKPLIQHVIDRVNKSRFVSKLLVATSINSKDDKLVNYLKKSKIKTYRGDLKNVAARMLSAANLNKANFFVRISGDSPLIDYKLIDRIIKVHKKNGKKFDIVTNVFPRSFPKGQSVELVKTKILQENLHVFTKLDLEHVTKYFYKNYKKFKIKNIKNLSKKISLKQSIDTKKDLKNMLYNLDKKNKFEKFKII